MSFEELSKYSVITPVKNEAKFIRKTIESMTLQTIRPREWIIVNDGSEDDTAVIVARAAAEYPWIRLVSREEKGARQRGKVVVETFYVGYRALTEDYDFIVKLDGDVSFERNYFESLLRQFAANPMLGIAGGGVYEQPNNRTWELCTTRDHVRGATKMYRRACFQDIGGLIPVMGWDGIDEWKALYSGWEVKSFLEYKMFHYRYTGTATGRLRNWAEEGHAAYYMGYHPLYMLARGIWRLASRPYIVGGIAMVATFVADCMRSGKRLPDAEVVDYIRRYQLRHLAGLLRGQFVHKS